MKRLAAMALLTTMPLSANAQTLFPEADKDGCYVIAEDFTFCGASLGWIGSASSHPDITAIFTTETGGEWLDFKIFDPENGTLGAMDGTPSTDVDELMKIRRQTLGPDAAYLSEGSKVLSERANTMGVFEIHSSVVEFTNPDGTKSIRTISEYVGEPWILVVSTALSGHEDATWKRHIEALEVLKIDK